MYTYAAMLVAIPPAAKRLGLPEEQEHESEDSEMSDW